MKAQTGMQPRDKWIPWYFVVFFLLLFILDGIFVYLALSSHRGVVTEQAYQKGLQYNETVEAANQQAALGWQGAITHENGAVLFALRDAQETPISKARVTAYFSRPTQAGSDFSLTLDSLQKGLYGKTVSFPVKGQWDVKIVATWNQQQYQQRRRILVP
ncbi:MAG: FixH family protein [Alphaproteobacteria bacterium]